MISANLIRLAGGLLLIIPQARAKLQFTRGLFLGELQGRGLFTDEERCRHEESLKECGGGTGACEIAGH